LMLHEVHHPKRRLSCARGYDSWSAPNAVSGFFA